jgi:hypothetical protein
MSARRLPWAGVSALSLAVARLYSLKDILTDRIQRR